jgi:hypothetical protein
MLHSRNRKCDRNEAAEGGARNAFKRPRRCGSPVLPHEPLLLVPAATTRQSFNPQCQKEAFQPRFRGVSSPFGFRRRAAARRPEGTGGGGSRIPEAGPSQDGGGADRAWPMLLRPSLLVLLLLQAAPSLAWLLSPASGGSFISSRPGSHGLLRKAAVSSRRTPTARQRLGARIKKMTVDGRGGGDDQSEFTPTVLPGISQVRICWLLPYTGSHSTRQS